MTQEGARSSGWGGAREGAGRKATSRPGRTRTMRFIATDAEWAFFQTLVDRDPRRRFVDLFLATLLSTAHDYKIDDDDAAKKIVAAAVAEKYNDGKGKDDGMDRT